MAYSHVICMGLAGPRISSGICQAYLHWTIVFIQNKY